MPGQFECIVRFAGNRPTTSRPASRLSSSTSPNLLQTSPLQRIVNTGPSSCVYRLNASRATVAPTYQPILSCHSISRVSLPPAASVVGPPRLHSYKITFQMKKSRGHFNIVLRPEPEGGFTVIVPALPGCVTYGRTLAEAKKMANDAISGYVASLRKHNEPVPPASRLHLSLTRSPSHP